MESAPKVWLSTVRPDDRPHIMPVLLVWVDDMPCFTTRPTSRKARNLARNTHCVLTVASEDLDLVVDYVMDTGPDTTMVTNPARVAARKKVTATEAELAAAERALPQILAGPASPAQMNAALPRLHEQIAEATTAVADAKTELGPIPAKVLATDLDPDAKRAHPRIERRGLQMVLRLLAFNAEAWLAEHLNAYLADPDEYRAITRNLLHQGGHVDYQPTTITVTLDRPDSPRVARALELLTEELNATPPQLPGDHQRTLTYQLAAAT